VGRWGRHVHVWSVWSSLCNTPVSAVTTLAHHLLKHPVHKWHAAHCVVAIYESPSATVQLARSGTTASRQSSYKPLATARAYSCSVHHELFVP